MIVYGMKHDSLWDETMFKSPNAGMVWVGGTLKTFKRYILK